MNTQRKTAWRGGIKVLYTESHYNRKAKWLRSFGPIKALLLTCLESTIIWFPTHGLMSIAVVDWLIQALRLRAV